MDYQHLSISLPAFIQEQITNGQFDLAIKALEELLSNTNSDEIDMVDRIMIEKKRLSLYASEFTVTQETLVNMLKKSVDGICDSEIDTLLHSGLLQWHNILGIKHYHSRAIKTALRINYKAITTHHYFDGLKHQAYLDALKTHIYALYKCKAYTFSATVKHQVSNTYPFSVPTELSVYIPVPKYENVNILDYKPFKPSVDNILVSQRTAFFETMSVNASFEFAYHFSVKAKRKKFSLRHEQLLNRYIKKPYYFQKDEFLEENFSESRQSALMPEKPHMVFKEELVKLVNRLIEGTEDDFERAWCLYDYVTRHIRYTFMPDYRLIDNLSLFAYKNQCGDCGTQVLLLITMMRIAGIPATFCSGVIIDPVTKEFGQHDWLAYYIKEYGWIEADVSYGADAFSTSDEAMRQFYFTGVDLYRIQMNTAFQKKWTNEKIIREDPFDNQLGEIGITDSFDMDLSNYIRRQLSLESFNEEELI